MAIGNLTNNMMTVSEASKILHVHPNTLRRWSDKGIIKSYCITSRDDRRFYIRGYPSVLAEMYRQNQ